MVTRLQTLEYLSIFVVYFDKVKIYTKYVGILQKENFINCIRNIETKIYNKHDWSVNMYR